MPYDSQSNTQQGDIRLLASVALTDKEGYLAKIVNSSGTAKAALPTDVADQCDYVIIEGAAAGSYATLRPLVDGAQVRMRLNGTCVPGDIIVPAVINGTDDGKVQKLPATADVYSHVGVAEESGADEQLVKVRVRRHRSTVTVS